MNADGESRHPTLRIIRGDATAEEIAALLAVLCARAGRVSASSARAGTSRARPAWNDRSPLLRAPLRPGPGAWRSSAWPW
jgi:hypothetical protein